MKWPGDIPAIFVQILARFVIARSDLSAVAQRAKAEATKQSTLTSRQYGLLRLRSQ